MLNCEQITPLLFDYLDGLCSGEEKQQLEEHLKQCPHCRAELERCRQTIALIQSAEYMPQKSLADTVIAEIRREKALRRKKMRNFCSTAAACVVLAVVLAVLPYVTRFTGMGRAESDAAASTEAGRADQEACIDIQHSLTYSDPSSADNPLIYVEPSATGAAKDDSDNGYSNFSQELADQAAPEGEVMAPKAEAAPQTTPTNDLFSVYASAYCPDYADEVSLLCVGNDAASHLGDTAGDAALTKGANYTLYRLPHTDALARSLTDLGKDYKINCYPGRENGQYIVYVEIR